MDVTGADAINEVLRPVYAALDVDFEPAATGALSDLIPDITMVAVVAAIVAELEALREISGATLSSTMVQHGRDMLGDHLVTTAGD